MDIKRAKQFGLAIAITLVFVLLVATGINTFYPAPDYERCYERFPPEISKCDLLENESDRLTCFEERRSGSVKESEEMRQCEEDNRAIRSVYNRNVFIVMLIAGIIAALIGFYLEVAGVSLGLIYGGILSVFIGTVIFWSDMQEYLRFVLLIFVLALLIWFGYKKIKK